VCWIKSSMTGSEKIMRQHDVLLRDVGDRHREEDHQILCAVESARGNAILLIHRHPSARNPRLHVLGSPVLRMRTLSLCTCCRHYPGAAAGRTASLIHPSRISLPRKGCRVGLRIVLFEACSAFTRVTACTLALSPYFVTRYPKASATSLPP
jgi:hypothetical protein